LAWRLAQRGHDLVVAARDVGALETLAHDLRAAHGVEVRVVVADLATSDGVDRLVTAALVETRVPALVVNNAGAGEYGPWLDGDPERERAMLRLNVEAPTRLARHLLPAMAANGGGRLLNVASVGAFAPGPRLAVYYATKAYLLSWSLALAEELRGSPLSVTCLCPGPMPTNFQARSGFRSGGLAARALTDPSAVAEAGLRGAFAGRALVVPGWANRLAAFAPRLLPRSWVVAWVHRLQRRRGAE
jgi:hypothetical protein